MFILDMNQLFFTITICLKFKSELITEQFPSVIIRNVSKFVHLKVKSLSSKELKRKCYKGEKLNLEYQINILSNISYRIVFPEKAIKDGLSIDEFMSMIESDMTLISKARTGITEYEGKFVSIKQMDENSFLIIINFN